MSEPSIFFTTGNLITDIGVISFALWVYWHSKKKEECYAERERINNQKQQDLLRLEEYGEHEKELQELRIRNLAMIKNRISSNEWDKEWNLELERHSGAKEALNNEKSKIDWKEANSISDFQGNYFHLFKYHKIYLWVIIAILFIGIIIQSFAICKACDFSIISLLFTHIK